jgi:hypothetical protein
MVLELIRITRSLTGGQFFGGTYLRRLRNDFLRIKRGKRMITYRNTGETPTGGAGA